MATMFTWTLNAQVDTIITATGELGNPESNLDFLYETGRLTRFPRLTDVGELLYYPPIVTTDSVTNITHSSAIVYGNILFNGWCENVLEQGFQISTTADFSESVTSYQVTSSYSDCEPPCLENAYSVSFTGLMYLTTYYVRAYATNEKGTGYGEIMTLTNSSEYEEWDGTGRNPNDSLPCKENPTITDVDGNVYSTVQIGNQCWMRENLKTTKYADGTSISLGSVTSSSVAYRYYPNNDTTNVAAYGMLYNWKAVMGDASSSDSNPSGVQGICPTGWHVPSNGEWIQLTDYVSSQSKYWCNSNRTYIAKALASTTGWRSQTIICAIGNYPIANNATGFSAMPAGLGRSDGNNTFSTYTYAYYWSATENNKTMASGILLNASQGSPYHNSIQKQIGRSVRCLRNQTLPSVSTSPVGDITSTSAIGGGVITNDGNCAVTARGVCWSTSHNPTIDDNKTTDGTGAGNFTSNLTGLTAGTTYYVRAYATNSVGTAYGDEVAFTPFLCGNSTISDIDNNIYNTVQIGEQCWMKENLRTTRYADGISIILGSSTSNDVPYWYYPNNDSLNKASYGLLYNWEAVMGNTSSSNTTSDGVQGICPNGWHVPSDAEWTELTEYVGNQSEWRCGNNKQYVAKALAATEGWRQSASSSCAVGYHQNNNNATGFFALPAGVFNGIYVQFNERTYFWSYGTDGQCNRSIYYYSTHIYTNYDNLKKNGFSVRCLRD